MPPDATGHIAFVGFMGAGKSTTAELVARRLGRPWYDSDHVMVERSGRSIPELFASGGEARFRALEKEVIAELLSGPPAVLSLGGGALEDADTRALLLERAFVVCLDVLWSDVRDELPVLMQTRPLLQDRSEAEIHQLFQHRQTTYAQAQLHIRPLRGDVAAAAEQVLSHLAP